MFVALPFYRFAELSTRVGFSIVWGTFFPVQTAVVEEFWRQQGQAEKE